ncbi:MAG: acetylglutamate kinase [Francisellaceae bacterium]
MQKPLLYIVKIGGKVVDDEEALKMLLRHFAQLKTQKVLIHGGGNQVDARLERCQIKPVFHHGRRITDKPTLEMVTMVLAGLINKQIVSHLQALKCDAIGLSGADANLIRAIKRKNTTVDFGFVGDIDRIDSRKLSQLLDLKLMPVLCSVTHDGESQLLNTNADTIASAIAIAMSKTHRVRLLYCFDLPGLLGDVSNQQTLIPRLDHSAYRDLKDKGHIKGGMLPKLENCFQALQCGVDEVYIGNAEGISNRLRFGSDATGTTIIL